MDEIEFRSAIAEEARTWINTPYHMSGNLKGVGVNCAQFLYGVARNAGVLPEDAPDPRRFTAEFVALPKEQRLAAYIHAYGGREITQAEVKTGDIVFYESRGEHGHTAIVLDWPNVIHSMPLHGCQAGLVDEGKMAAKTRHYFTLWNPVESE